MHILSPFTTERVMMYGTHRQNGESCASLPVPFTLVSCFTYSSALKWRPYVPPIGWLSTSDMASYRRRLNSSQPPMWEPQILLLLLNWYILYVPIYNAEKILMIMIIKTMITITTNRKQFIFLWITSKYSCFYIITDTGAIHICIEERKVK
jgi:hypothetical protein